MYRNGHHFLQIEQINLKIPGLYIIKHFHQIWVKVNKQPLRLSLNKTSLQINGRSDPPPPHNFVCGGFNKYVSILFHPNFIIRDSKHQVHYGGSRTRIHMNNCAMSAFTLKHTPDLAKYKVVYHANFFLSALKIG